MQQIMGQKIRISTMDISEIYKKEVNGGIMDGRDR